MEIRVCKTYRVTLGNFHITSGQAIVCQLATLLINVP